MIENHDNLTFDAPYSSIVDGEIREMMISFCSLCSILSTRKLNLQNILILLLKDKDYMEILKSITGEQLDKNCLKAFIRLDPTAFSSKTIIKHLKS